MIVDGVQSTVLMQTLFSGSTSFSLAVYLWWSVEKQLILRNRNASDGKADGTPWNKLFVHMLFAQNNFFYHKQHVPDTPAAKLSYTTAKYPLMQALQGILPHSLSSGCTHSMLPQLLCITVPRQLNFMAAKIFPLQSAAWTMSRPFSFFFPCL